jgi:hypothetical protein
MGLLLITVRRKKMMTLLFGSQRNLSRSGRTKMVSGALHSSFSSREELLPVTKMELRSRYLTTVKSLPSVNWGPLMSQIDDFYTYFPKAADETEDEFNRRKYEWRTRCRPLWLGIGSMKSVYRMTLPFRVDPTVRIIRFLGTSDGCRFAHIDLAERKKFEVEQAIMLDTQRKQLTSSAQKRSYCSLYFDACMLTGCILGI